MRRFFAISAAATLALGLAACNKPAEEAAEPAAAEAEPATAEPAAAAAPADATAAPAAGDAASTPADADKKATEDQQSSGGVNPN